jgi:hypothetical protein
MSSGKSYHERAKKTYPLLDLPAEHDSRSTSATIVNANSYAVWTIRKFSL